MEQAKRKRGRKPMEPSIETMDFQIPSPGTGSTPLEEAVYNPLAETPASETPTVHKRRGRPRKFIPSPVQQSNGVSQMRDVDIPKTDASPARRQRGRPRTLKPSSGKLNSSSVQANGVSQSRDLLNRETPKQSENVIRGSARSRVVENNGDCSLGLTVVHPPIDHLRYVPIMEAIKENVAKVVPSMDAVVKVFCVHTEPNLSLPWQRKRQYSSSSSGFIIGGRRVLTNAHSVEHYTQVKLKKRGSDVKYLATVLAIGTECDIAMLTVNDNEFWEGVSPVDFGSLPALQDAVTVVGYPIGGDTISVTSGVVSRMEILSYVHGSTELLGLQIDAAINSGNSGGPAFNDKGNCVGIAFQSLKHEDAENIGYVIPTPVIMHFIRDYEQSGEYTGFPVLGVEWQKMENPDLRKVMGMLPHQKGVRVRRVEPTAPEHAHLKPSDIILSFDGVDIANDGTVPFRHGERIGFSYLVSQKYTGDNAVVRVLRNSKIFEFNVQLATHKRLVPAHIKGMPPSYYIIAGFVFTTVSVPYLRSEYGKEYEYDAPVKLLDKHLHSMAQTEDEQLVVVSQVLVADINIGYEYLVNTQVLAFNGKPIRNLKQLADMVEHYSGPFLQFDLEYQQLVVLDTKAARAATLDILTTHCIPSAMSEDLKT